MATIIEFPNTVLENLDADVSGSRKLAAGNASAEIIIFPGVRIEHWDAEPQRKSMQSAGPGVRRDQMKLLDC